MIGQIGTIVAAGLTGGIVAGTIVFFLNWIMTSAIKIIKQAGATE